MELAPEPMFGLFIGKVNAILANYPALRHGGNFVLVDNGHQAIIAAFRESTGNQMHGFLIVCNFDINNEQFISIDLTQIINTTEPIPFCELLSERTGVFSGPQLEFSLQPCSAHVFMLTEMTEGIGH